MNTLFRKTWLIFVVLGVALFMTGCFGLFSSKPAPTEPTSTLLEGTLSGPAGLTVQADSTTALQGHVLSPLLNYVASLAERFSASAAMASLRLLPGEQPLADVPVAVYGLDPMQADPGAAAPITIGRTDADGKFTLIDIPTGSDLVVVTLTEPRLTTIVPSPGRRTTVTVNSATSLTSEALAADLRENGGTVNSDRWARGVGDIESFLHDFDLDAEALLGALNDLIPDDFGAGLPETPPASWLPLAEAVMGAVVMGYDGTYDIEGIVFNEHENGVPGVEIAFSDGYESVFTGADGMWYKDGLSGEVTVTVMESDTFKPMTSEWSPESVTVSEYTWVTFFGEVLVLVDPPYAVSGEVKLADGSPLADVDIVVHRHDEAVVTDEAGVFTVSNIGLQTTVRPVKEGYIFQPAVRTVTGEASGLQFEAFTIEEVAIEFADPNLEAAVRDWLKYHLDEPDAPITLEHVPLLTTLTTWDVSISDLSGVEHFVHLDTLYIGYEDNFQLDDLSPLAELDNLRMVLINNSSVSDLSPLANKPRMQDLTLNNNQIEDISVVATLPTVTSLKLNNNPLSDLSPLENWERTAPYSLVLELNNTQITDVAALKHLDLGPTYLNDNDYLTDISGLLFTPVTYLQIRNTPALDWCDYDSTWRVVDELLRRDGARVFTNTRCEGPYELSGIIELADGSAFVPDTEFEVVFKGNEGAWSSTAEPWGTDVFGWEQTVEGQVSIEPRAKSAASTSYVWRFEPKRKINVNRPEMNIVFTAHRLGVADPVLQGYVDDVYGNPVPGVEITLADDTTDAVLATVMTDEFGYFAYEFDNMQWLNVYAEKPGWVFGPILGVNTPKQLRLVGTEGTGGTIAFVRDGKLRTVLPNGSNDTQVADIGYGLNNGMAWSPDGSQIAFAKGSDFSRELRVVYTNGTNNRLITSGTEADIRGPSWDAAGGILYSHRMTGGYEPSRNPWHLNVTSAGGGAGTTLAIDADTHYLDAGWSPDGTQIVLSAQPTVGSGGAIGIYTMDADGSNVSAKLVDGALPAWSPAGDAIAYTNDGDIYVYDVVAATSKRVVQNGTHPTWSPDGLFMAFEREGAIYTIYLESHQDPVRIVTGTNPVWSPL